MIFIICSVCGSGVSLTRKHRKACECGKATGVYRGDKIHLTKEAVPLGVLNEDLLKAIRLRPELPEGSFGPLVEARVLPEINFIIEKGVDDV